ncbi:MAG: hypothetical protein IJO47_07765, partial [Clostridia bacterium]|nr:hypothetical protein [Clostridia bacterium]
DFDYSADGKYFVTVCTHEKKKILSSIEYVGEGLCALPQIKLTEIGKIVEESINFVDKNTEGVVIEKYIIMPNHIHLLNLRRAGMETRPYRMWLEELSLIRHTDMAVGSGSVHITTIVCGRREII